MKSVGHSPLLFHTKADKVFHALYLPAPVLLPIIAVDSGPVSLVDIACKGLTFVEL